MNVWCWKMQKAKYRYYFIDKEIYYQNEKLPDRKVELVNVRYEPPLCIGHDEDGNEYTIHIDNLIIELVKEE